MPFQEGSAASLTQGLVEGAQDAAQEDAVPVGGGLAALISEMRSRTLRSARIRGSTWSR